MRGSRTGAGQTDRRGLGAGVARGCGDDCEREQNSQPDALKAEMLASDGTVTLYAVWAEKDFVSMTFDAGEGSFADDSKEKVESVRPGHLLKNEI